MRRRQVSPEALAILGAMIIEGDLAKITAGQLSRSLYLEVNECQMALGGKWNRKRGGHVFEGDPRDALDQVVLTGGLFTDRKRDFGFFETPHYVDKQFDRILMNPPFSRQADVDHVLHAHSLLAPAGRLVAIMSAGVTFRCNGKTEALRSLIEKHGAIESLPEHAFRESGTDVRTVLVTIDKPEGAVEANSHAFHIKARATPIAKTRTQRAD
jgi:hypothetical protein